MLTVSVLLQIFGISSILYLNGITAIPLGFYEKIGHLAFRYIFVLASMGGGITLFTSFAASFEDKKRRDRLSVGIGIYAFVLTLPLVYTFVACFFVANDIMLFMADEIAIDLMDILVYPALYYTGFALATIVAIIALIVPVLTAYLTVKEMTMKDFFAKLKK